MKSHLVFDIETGPLPEEEILPFAPEFKAPGNWKDEAKISKYIEEEKQKWLDKAALSATTGKVLAIGIKVEGQDAIPQHFAQDEDRDETWVIESFWNLLQEKDFKLVGFNCVNFDLPFLIHRSWMLGLRLPDWIDIYNRFAPYGKYRVIDLMHLYQVGDRQRWISLDKLARFLGVGCKNGNGALFFKMFREDREAAIEYLNNDIEITYACAEKLRVILGY